MAGLRVRITEAVASSDPGTSRPRPVQLPSLVPLVRGVDRLPGRCHHCRFPRRVSRVFVQGSGSSGPPRTMSVPSGKRDEGHDRCNRLRDIPSARTRPEFQDDCCGPRGMDPGCGERRFQPRSRCRGASQRAARLLEGAHDPSACNIADYLARWDAGRHPRLRAEDERDGGRARPEAHALCGRGWPEP